MYSIRSFILSGLLAPLPFGASIPLTVVPLETAPDLPYTWDYKGCFIDRVGNRALKRASTSDVEMTGGMCTRWCAEQGFNIAGTEWGRECYCGYELNKPVQTQERDCSMPCTGWSGEVCGGSQRITVYETLSGNPPATNPGVPGFPSLGCYSDSVANRTLPVKVSYDGGLDVAKCVATCANQGYALAGVEYAYECYCGNILAASSRSIAGDGSASGCDFTCSGNSEEFCGGSNRMNLYGSLPAIIPSSSLVSTSTATPTAAPSSSTTSTTTTPATTSAAASVVTTPTTDTSPTMSPVIQIPTSEEPTPSAPSSTLTIEQPTADTSTSSSILTPTPTSSPVIDLGPVDPIIGFVL